jgi:hypothetical protein
VIHRHFLCLAKIKSSFEINNIQSVRVACYMDDIQLLQNFGERAVPELRGKARRLSESEVPIIREIMAATTMSSLFVALFGLLASSVRTRAALQAEILALRHQLAVFQKNAPRRLRLHRCDRLLWVVFSRFWSGWRRCLQMLQPDKSVLRENSVQVRSLTDPRDIPVIRQNSVTVECRPCNMLHVLVVCY